MTENKKYTFGWWRKRLIRNVKRNRDLFEKGDWTRAWIEDNFGSPLGTTSQVIDDLVFITFGVFVLSCILALYFCFMIYKDALLNLTVQMMVDEAQRYGMGFPQVYASLGAAIIIFVFMLVTPFLLLLRWSPKKDLTEGLADIAHTLEVRLPKNAPGGEDATIDMNETESMYQKLDSESQTKVDERIKKYAYHDE